MSGFLTVLPLAFVMIAGPQIISAVFLATSVDGVFPTDIITSVTVGIEIEGLVNA